MGRNVPAVVGIGTTDFGKFPEQDRVALGLWALREAIADSGIARSAIDGLIVHRITDYQRFVRLSGLAPAFVSAAPPQGRMSGTAIQMAASLIESGAARCIALVYSNDGSSARLRKTKSDDGEGDDPLWASFGMTSMGGVPAMQFQRHRKLYGTTTDQLGEIAVTFRAHAALNPGAALRAPITLDDYRAERFICEPLRLLDYCIMRDGAVSMIMTSSERAKDFKQPPVYLRGYALESRLHDTDFPEDFGRPTMKAIADRPFGMAGVTHKDIDALMIYDNFSPHVLFNLEGYGYCPVGEGGSWVQEGHLRLGGRYPANTNGGHLSETYMHGWSLNVEAVRQVRGQCGPRQVAGARHVHYMSSGPVSSSIIYGRDKS